MIIETSYSDANENLAGQAGHLCPRLLTQELETLDRPVDIPIGHMKPGMPETILREIDARTWRSLPRPLALGQMIEF